MEKSSLEDSEINTSLQRFWALTSSTNLPKPLPDLYSSLLDTHKISFEEDFEIVNEAALKKIALSMESRRCMKLLLESIFDKDPLRNDYFHMFKTIVNKMTKHFPVFKSQNISRHSYKITLELTNTILLSFSISCRKVQIQTASSLFCIKTIYPMMHAWIVISNLNRISNNFNFLNYHSETKIPFNPKNNNILDVYPSWMVKDIIESGNMDFLTSRFN